MDGRDALVAFGMNGEPLPVEHGFPARLVVPGVYGYVSATKWLTRLELTRFDDFDAYWVKRGWSDRGPIKTFSRVDTPAALKRIAAGRHPIAGVAWAQTVGIDAVEVRVDGGRWMPAELSEELNDVDVAPVDAAVRLRLGPPRDRVPGHGSNRGNPNGGPLRTLSRRRDRLAFGRRARRLTGSSRNPDLQHRSVHHHQPKVSAPCATPEPASPRSASSSRWLWSEPRAAMTTTPPTPAPSDTTETTEKMADTTMADDAMTEPTGPGCAAVPTDGAGSFDGMADDPAATAASNNPALSTLVAAVQAAGLVDTLNGDGPFTIFAPTNDAFAKIPADTLNAVLADKEQLTKILTYHVVAGEKMDGASLVDAGTATTVEGGDLTVTASGDTVKVNDATVVCANIPTANATVHLIDTVLMPPA